MTSLCRKDFSRTAIRELYHLRWEVEEFYKLAQSDYIGQGQFRSKTSVGIEQEIHVLTLFLGISRHIMAIAARDAGCQEEEISQKAAVLATAAYVVRIFLQAAGKKQAERLRELLQLIAKCRYRRRPGRSFTRRSFKPGPPWGPDGRRGG